MSSQENPLSPLDAVKQAIQKLPASPAAIIMQNKIKDGTFESWLEEGLANDKKLSVTSKEWEKACDAMRWSGTRRWFLCALPLMGGLACGLGAIGTAEMQKYPARQVLDTRYENLVKKTQRYMERQDPTPKQRDEINLALTECQTAKQAFDRTAQNEFQTICLYMSIGSASVGALGTLIMETAEVVQKVRNLHQDISPEWCAKKLQSQLDVILAKHHPKLYESLQRKTDAITNTR